MYRKNITKAHVYDSWETIITRSNTNTALNCTKRGLPAHLRQQPMVDELLCEYKTGSIRKCELHFLVTSAILKTVPLNFSSHTQADYCCSYFNIRQFYTASPHIFAVLFCTLCPSMVNIMYETYKVRESVWIKAFTQISQANTQPYYLRFLRVHIPLEL